MSSQEDIKEKSISSAITILPVKTTQRTSTLCEVLKLSGLRLDTDGYIRWAKTNAKHPRNWAPTVKLYNTIVILMLEFITSAAATAGTSAGQAAQRDYDISRGFSIFAFTSMYLLGQGIGGAILPPYSECFGRKTLYLLSTIGYCAFSVIVATVPALPFIMVARFICGFLSAIPTIVVAGSMEDMYNMRARVWMIFVWVTTGNMGIILGPIFSTYVTVTLGWRWVFYIATSVTGVLFVLCFWLKESRPSRVLDTEVALLQKLMPEIGHELKTLNPDSVPDIKTLLHVVLLRPLLLLFTEPIIIMITIMGCVACSLWYLFADALLLVFAQYGWSEGRASLSFAPMAIGCLSAFAIRVYDYRLLTTRQANGKALEPEHKLFGFVLSAPCLAVGLWWFAWSVPPAVHVHWIVPMLALVLIGFALNELVFTLSGYLADSYTVYAGSGFAGLILARGLIAAAMIPFTNSFYLDMGANSATSVLAGVATVFCVAPYVLIRYGKRIREASRFARFSLDVYRENRVEDDMNETTTAGSVVEEGNV